MSYSEPVQGLNDKEALFGLDGTKEAPCDALTGITGSHERKDPEAKGNHDEENAHERDPEGRQANRVVPHALPVWESRVV